MGKHHLCSEWSGLSKECGSNQLAGDETLRSCLSAYKGAGQGARRYLLVQRVVVAGSAMGAGAERDHPDLRGNSAVGWDIHNTTGPDLRNPKAFPCRTSGEDRRVRSCSLPLQRASTQALRNSCSSMHSVHKLIISPCQNAARSGVEHGCCLIAGRVLHVSPMWLLAPLQGPGPVGARRCLRARGAGSSAQAAGLGLSPGVSGEWHSRGRHSSVRWEAKAAVASKKQGCFRDPGRGDHWSLLIANAA